MKASMNIFCIDFETYYDKDFSLSKLTTEEYIRSKDFEVIGVAVQRKGEEPVWFSGTQEKTKEWLEQFNFADHAVIAHNAVFDMAILNWHFDIRPKIIVDTLSMARALHGTEVGGSLKVLAEHYNLGVKGTEVLDAKGKQRIDFNAEDLASYGEYCRNDVRLTMDLFEQLSGDFPLFEYKLIDLTIRMFTEPVLELDRASLVRLLEEIHITKNALLLRATSNRESLLSNAKFAQELESLGVTCPIKISPTTGKETWALSKNDEEFKALLEHENPIVQALASARIGIKSTLEETRTMRFMDIEARGALPIPLRYYAAHTGRWGGDDKINMQNLGRKSNLKYAIRAPDGYALIDADSSQIEARTLAWLASQNDLVDAFERGEDVYKIMASAIYNKPVEEITPDERFVGKTTILGCGYGMGNKKFRIQLKTFNVDLSEEECERIIKVYRETYDWIPALWKRASTTLDAMIENKTISIGRDKILVVDGKKGIRLPNGMYIKYPNLRKVDKDNGGYEYVYDVKKGKSTYPSRIYGGKVIENVCQALARIIIGEQMLMINKKYKVVMTVHDAVACVVPEHELATAREYVVMCMRMRPKWAMELPLNCESGVGRTYGHCSAKEAM
jgi:DNA polymerase